MKSEQEIRETIKLLYDNRPANDLAHIIANQAVIETMEWCLGEDLTPKIIDGLNATSVLIKGVKDHLARQGGQK